jgi:C4-dicarboxylate-specific signal transduction histidine kinase
VEAGADDLLLGSLPPHQLRERVDLLARLVETQRQLSLGAVRCRMLQAQLEEAQRLATLGTFARGVGHEMNNVATVLKSALEEVSRTRTVESEVLEELQLATAQLQGLAGALQRLAAPSQQETMLDVRTVVRDVVALARLTGRTKYAAVELDLPPAPVVARRSPSQAQQVVLSLLTASAEAVARHGEGRIRIALRSDRDQVRLSVEDNADAAAPDASASRPFWTPVPGLGLEPTRDLVRGWGGSLDVVRLEGRGSVTQVCFPSDPSSRPT